MFFSVVCWILKRVIGKRLFYWDFGSFGGLMAVVMNKERVGGLVVYWSGPVADHLNGG